LVWKEINYAHMRPIEKQRIADEVSPKTSLRSCVWGGHCARI
jgi:hypothetical protein